MPRISSTGYIGVHKHSIGKQYNLKKPFFARVQAVHSVYHLGSFATAEQAARARDKKARQLLGEWAPMNFPI